MKGLGNLLKKEIISLFLLTTEFLNFNIQGELQLNFRRDKKHSRIILVCGLAGPSCVPSILNLGEKALNRDIDNGSLKRYSCLSISSIVKIGERIWKAIVV